jgi:hypothetical protein
MTARDFAAALGVALLPALLVDCHSVSVEPAPPPVNYELVIAPPGARGARAAGTDAAPPAPTERELAGPDEADDPDEDDTEGGVGDAGALTDASPGVAL